MSTERFCKHACLQGNIFTKKMVNPIGETREALATTTQTSTNVCSYPATIALEECIGHDLCFSSPSFPSYLRYCEYMSSLYIVAIGPPSILWDEEYENSVSSTFLLHQNMQNEKVEDVGGASQGCSPSSFPWEPHYAKGLLRSMRVVTNLNDLEEQNVDSDQPCSEFNQKLKYDVVACT